MTKPHIPSELPVKPEGWTRRMSMHLNYGRDGGAAVFSIHDEQGRATCIVYQYDTRKATPARPAIGKSKARPAIAPSPTGFHVPAVDSDVFPSLAALREAWPSILAKLAEKNEGAAA